MASSRAKRLAAQAEAYGPEFFRDRNLKLRYGLDRTDYDHMVAEQAGRCKLCQSTQTKPLYVDHDHETGRVRGLLCFHCNVALGHFRDDPELLEAALSYLRG